MSMSTLRILPVHAGAILVELESLERTLALLETLQQRQLEGVEEVIPAARTLLISFKPWVVSREALVAQLRALPIDTEVAHSGELVEIPVRYDGEDLAEVAKHLGITPEEVVRRHTGSEYSVAFTGFAPGFAYLTGGILSLTSPVAARRAPVFLRARWPWRARLAGCILPPALAVGSCWALRPWRCGMCTVNHLRCCRRGKG